MSSRRAAPRPLRGPPAPKSTSGSAESKFTTYETPSTAVESRSEEPEMWDVDDDDVPMGIHTKYDLDDDDDDDVPIGMRTQIDTPVGLRTRPRLFSQHLGQIALPRAAVPRKPWQLLPVRPEDVETLEPAPAARREVRPAAPAPANPVQTKPGGAPRPPAEVKPGGVQAAAPPGADRPAVQARWEGPQRIPPVWGWPALPLSPEATRKTPDPLVDELTKGLTQMKLSQSNDRVPLFGSTLETQAPDVAPLSAEKASAMLKESALVLERLGTVSPTPSEPLIEEVIEPSVIAHVSPPPKGAKTQETKSKQDEFDVFDWKQPAAALQFDPSLRTGTQEEPTGPADALASPGPTGIATELSSNNNGQANARLISRRRPLEAPTGPPKNVSHHNWFPPNSVGWRQFEQRRGAGTGKGLDGQKPEVTTPPPPAKPDAVKDVQPVVNPPPKGSIIGAGRGAFKKPGAVPLKNAAVPKAASVANAAVPEAVPVANAAVPEAVPVANAAVRAPTGRPGPGGAPGPGLPQPNKPPVVPVNPPGPVQYPQFTQESETAPGPLEAAPSDPAPGPLEAAHVSITVPESPKAPTRPGIINKVTNAVTNAVAKLFQRNAAKKALPPQEPVLPPLETLVEDTLVEETRGAPAETRVDDTGPVVVTSPVVAPGAGAPYQPSPQEVPAPVRVKAPVVPPVASRAAAPPVAPRAAVPPVAPRSVPPAAPVAETANTRQRRLNSNANLMDALATKIEAAVPDKTAAMFDMQGLGSNIRLNVVSLGCGGFGCSFSIGRGPDAFTPRLVKEWQEIERALSDTKLIVKVYFDPQNETRNEELQLAAQVQSWVEGAGCVFENGRLMAPMINRRVRLAFLTPYPPKIQDAFQGWFQRYVPKNPYTIQAWLQDHAAMAGGVYAGLKAKQYSLMPNGGQSLLSWMKYNKPRVTPVLVCEWMQVFAHGYALLNAQGWAHNDIKAANVTVVPSSFSPDITWLGIIEWGLLTSYKTKDDCLANIIRTTKNTYVFFPPEHSVLIGRGGIKYPLRISEAHRIVQGPTPETVFGYLKEHVSQMHDFYVCPAYTKYQGALTRINAFCKEHQKRLMRLYQLPGMDPVPPRPKETDPARPVAPVDADADANSEDDESLGGLSYVVNHMTAEAADVWGWGMLLWWFFWTGIYRGTDECNRRWARWEKAIFKRALHASPAKRKWAKVQAAMAKLLQEEVQLAALAPFVAPRPAVQDPVPEPRRSGKKQQSRPDILFKLNPQYSILSANPRQNSVNPFSGLQNQGDIAENVKKPLFAVGGGGRGGGGAAAAGPRPLPGGAGGRGAGWAAAAGQRPLPPLPVGAARRRVDNLSVLGAPVNHQFALPLHHQYGGW